MNQAAHIEMAKMLNGFPQSRSTNIEALLLTYEEDLTGISDQAIIETAQRYRRNEIPNQSKEFAPSIAGFVDAAKRQEEIIEIRNRPRLAAPFDGGNGRSPFERNQARARAANAHLPVLFTGVSYDEWRRLSREKQVPVGGKWVACLATVYGPEPKVHWEAAE